MKCFTIANSLFRSSKIREYEVVADSQPGHIDQIKQTNAGAVYRLIDQLGPVSRIDLSRLAQLAPASITKIVREMLEAHLVQETEIQEPGSRGRPAVGLVVETEAWHYLSLRISRGEIFLALRDLSSKLVVEDRLELPLNAEQPLLDAIVTHIDQFFIRHQQRLERLTAIAITMPGIIDTENGIVHRMPFYDDVKEMPLGEVLKNHTGVPVYIQHDISAWTMAEALFGASRGARDVIQVVIDHNVGAGVITDGRLLHAGSSSLVEIGHTQVDPTVSAATAEPRLSGDHCQRGKRAGAGAGQAQPVHELLAARTTVNGGFSAPRRVRAICWRRTSLPVWGITLAAFWPSW
jgi:transcriptional regulator of PTS gene